jgi:hypothetical protein
MQFKMKVFGVLMFLCNATLFAQTPATPAQFLKTIPPTPTAAALGRYGEIPVSHTSGVPNIEIPVFTLQEGKINLPISFSYHASGIKVQDVATPSGLGWVLNAGGIVSRTILGFPDGSVAPFTYKSSDEINAARLNEGLEDVLGSVENMYNSQDSQTDRYVYNFNGHSGVFRKDFSTGSLFTIPYAPIKIRPYTISESPVGGFEIIDQDGNIYSFKEPETTNGGVSGGGGTTSWLLTSISSPDLKHVINFTYESETVYYQKQINQYFVFGTTHNYSLEGGSVAVIPGVGDIPSVFDSPNPIDDLYDLQGNFAFGSKNLVKIETDHTQINFTYSHDRTDITNISSLNKIEVIDKINTKTIKTVELTHSYFGQSIKKNLRFRLDQVDFKDGLNAAIESYKFGYNSTELPPYFDINNHETTYYEDYWGYYNDTTGSPSLIPKEYVPAAEISRAGDRNPNEELTKACSLEYIIYPTGGKTVFEFELNNAEGVQIHDYDQYTTMHCCDNFNNSLLGGLRVKRIKNYNKTDATQPAFQKEYEYELTHASFTYMYKELFAYSQNNFYAWNAPTGLGLIDSYVDELFELVFGNSLLPLTGGYSSAVAYGRITEYAGTKTDNIGKTVFTYEENPHHFPDPLVVGHPRYLSGITFDGGIYNPLLSSKTVYGNTLGSTPTYFLRQKTVNHYQYFNQATHVTGVNLHKNKIFINMGRSLTFPGFGSFVPLGEVYNSYVFSNTEGYEDVPLLTQTDQEEYDMNGVNKITTQVNFSYGNLTHLQPTQIITHNSKQEEVKTEYKYSTDFVTTAPYDVMVSKNILTPLIEKKNYKNSVFLTSQTTNYKDWGSGIVEPENQKVTVSTNPSEQVISYDGYDNKGNILQTTSRDGITKSLLWNYNSAYPVAESINAVNSAIAASSFESDGLGNWSYTTTAPTSIYGSVTGSKAYPLTGGDISRTVSNTETYVITYWLKDGTGSADISGSGEMALITKNGWTLYKGEISSVSSVSVTGTGVIDELRLFPKNAQMTTYTYDPLIGMTSVCDINNKITYYEYDSYGRLKLLRDADRNIIKTYDYKYQENQ